MAAMSVILSLAVVSAALYVIVCGGQFAEVTRNWAYTALAGLLAYWLRHPEEKK